MRSIDLFVFARALSYVADALKTFVVPVLVFARTGSAAMSGIALIVEFVPKVALATLLGALAQRFRLRPQFLVGEAARAVLCMALLVAPSIALVMVLSAAIAVASSYAYLLNESLVAVVFRDAERTAVQARLQAADQLARAAGPALGAALYAFCDARSILAIAGGLFLLCGLGLFCLPRSADRPAAGGDLRAIAGGMARAFAVLRQSPSLARLTFLMFATNFASGVILAVAPAMIAEAFRLPLYFFGIAASAAAVATAAMMALIGRGGAGAMPGLGRRSLAALALALALVVVAPNFAVFVAGYALFTVANTSFATYMRVERLRFIPAHAVGETIGLLTALLWLSVPFSGAVVALLVAPLGFRATLLAASLVTVVSILVLQRGLARRSRGPREPMGDAAPRIPSPSYPRSRHRS
jgi:MFS family permease